MERAPPRPRTLRERLKNFSLRSLFSRRRPTALEISVNNRTSMYVTQADIHEPEVLQRQRPPRTVATGVDAGIPQSQEPPRRMTTLEERIVRAAVARTRDGVPRAEAAPPPVPSQKLRRSRR